MNKQIPNIPAGSVTQEMIDGWKAQGYDVTRARFPHSDGEKICYLRNPERSEISYATAASATDPLKFNESLTESCWLAGDEIIKTHGGLSLSLGNKLSEIIGMVEVKLEKL